MPELPRLPCVGRRLACGGVSDVSRHAGVPSVVCDAGSACLRRTLGERRAIINEQELLQSITDAWDVEVVNTTFHMPLRDAISLMAETDILIGMHGAGSFCCSFLAPGDGHCHQPAHAAAAPASTACRAWQSQGWSEALRQCGKLHLHLDACRMRSLSACLDGEPQLLDALIVCA